MQQRKDFPTLIEAAKVWAHIAALSFGGPAGQIAVMHRMLVEERKWLGDGRFLHALNFCMLLPGPEAQQLATYIGWLMHGVRGALVAGLLFILPGVLAIMGLSWIYAVYGDTGFVSALFFGLKAAVLAIVLQAVVRLGRRALRNAAMYAIAAASFVAIFAFGAPFPLIVATAALIGWAGAKAGWGAFAAGGGHGSAGSARVEDAMTLLGAESTLPQAARAGAFRAGLVALVIWLLPVGALLLLAPGSVFA
ncbi:MAG: chromate transporter, partial [Gemmobacter sp.]